MSEVILKVEGMDAVQSALAHLPREVASAARNALNDTARDVQKSFRGSLAGKFDVQRKAAVDRQVYIGPQDLATRDKWEARVGIKGPGTQTSTLGKFERDGVKKARAGRVAVPAKAFRTSGGHVKSEIALNKLLPLVQMGGQYTKLKKKKGALVAGKTLTSKAQMVGKRGTFLVTLKQSGLEALVRRAKGQPKGWNKIEVLWVFKPMVKVGTRLTFEADASAHATARMPTHIGLAIEAAVKRARLA